MVSGERCLGFYWRGDQLFTRSGPVSLEESKNETCICLQLREPLECPDWDHFAQFLGKGVLFTASLEAASFSLDGQLQFRVEKRMQLEGVDEFKALAVSTLKSSSTGLFTLKSLQPLLLHVSIDKRFHSPEPSSVASSSSTSFLSGLWRMAQAHLTEKGRQESALEAQLRLPGKYALQLRHLRGTAAVKTPARFASEMERTTKKKPFSQVFIDLIWSGSGCDNAEICCKHPILKHLLPSERGKVYIGFETHQSTGLGIHLAAPFIPTVERESIDFVDGCLRQWNLELLQVAGKMARLIFERELHQSSSMQESSASRQDSSTQSSGAQATSKQSIKSLLKTFNFTDSTPAPHVCVALFREFLDQLGEIKLPAQNGKLVSISQLRFVPREMQAFMKNCPQVPADLEEACGLFLKRLSSSSSSASKKILPTANYSDIIQFELRQRQLSQEEIISLIKWWSKNAPASADLNREFASSLKIVHAHNQVTLSLAQFVLLPAEELIALHTAEPDWLRFWPVDCVPVRLAEEVGDLLRGLKVFSGAGWLESLAKSSAAQEAIQSDRDRAERLLLFCSKLWNSASDFDQGRMASVLASLACIPVASGALVLPRFCFFDDVAREGLLPADSVLAFSSDVRRSRLSVKMLKAAGVQSHLPLERVLQSSSAASLSTVQYLFKHREELSRSELEKIRNSAIFPSSSSGGTGALTVLSNLFAPNPVSNLLGLPRLSWTDPLPREGTELAVFLEQLGFNYTIPWRLVLDGVSKFPGDAERLSLFRYFFEHYAEYETFRANEIDFPFLPVQGDQNQLLLPSQVFLNEELEMLGFYLLAGDLRKWALQLGVEERPGSALLTQQICKSRLSVVQAQRLFAYLSRITFTATDVSLLSQAAFIPISETSGIIFKSPKQLFFKSTSNSEGGFAELFDQIDFCAAGNSFLRVAGVEDEPNIQHLVQLLCAGAGAESIFGSLGVNRYTKMMEKLAAGWSVFSRRNSALAKAFVGAPVFLASIKVEELLLENSSADADLDADTEEDEQKSRQFRLFKVNDVFLIDDTISQQIFNLPAVPTLLNDFYAQLGCKWISAVVRTDWKRSGKPDPNGSLAKEVQKILNDRLGLIASSLEHTNRRGRKKLSTAKIYQVEAIKISRTCLFLKKEDLQAVCAYTDGQGIYVAYGKAREFDHFDLAGVVVEMLCEQKGRLQDALLVATLITTPLASLRAKGFKIQETPDGDTTGKAENRDTEIIDAPLPKKELPPLPLPPLEPKQMIAPAPSKPISPIVPEAEETEQMLTPQIISEPASSEREPEHEPDALKSFFGILKKSTESLISKFNSSRTPSPVHQEPGRAGRARDEESLQSALQKGIDSLRKHKIDSLDATINEADRTPSEPTPPINRKQASDFCCENAQLKFYSVIGREEVRFYFPQGMSDAECASVYSQINAALIAFYGLIVEELGRGVFSVASLQSISIFYDTDSSAIAFNHSHSLFFNLAYFLANRHHQNPRSVKVRSFWFVTFCHELAHNFIAPHNSEHEYYMTCFLESYMPVFYSQIKN